MNTYKTTRAKAWRNVMVSAINELIRVGYLHLDPHRDPYLWPKWNNNEGKDYYTAPSYEHPFMLGGHDAIVHVEDIGHQEVRVWVSFPKRRACFFPADLEASGWLERKVGKWLQNPQSFGRGNFTASRQLTTEMAALDVIPDGYADAGRLMM